MVLAALLDRGWTTWLVTAAGRFGGRPSFQAFVQEIRYGAVGAGGQGATPAEPLGAVLVACLDEPGWAAATPEQRNAPARLVLRSVEIEDGRVTAVVAQPDFAPFFVARAAADGLLVGRQIGATGAAPSSEVMSGRKRRASLSHSHHGADNGRGGPAGRAARGGAVRAGGLPTPPDGPPD
jgi:hypothetical protein